MTPHESRILTDITRAFEEAEMETTARLVGESATSRCVDRVEDPGSSFSDVVAAYAEAVRFQRSSGGVNFKLVNAAVERRLPGRLGLVKGRAWSLVLGNGRGKAPPGPGLGC